MHAGFHKTGTSTLQATLADNMDVLAPHVEIYLPIDIPLRLLAHTVQNFSEHRNMDTKSELRDQAEIFFAMLDRNDPRPILVSHENLAGHYMGYKTVFRYAAAPIAMGLIRDAWETVTGSVQGFETYYSLRRSGWLESCHWQRLKSTRYTEPLDVFLDRYADAADFDPILDRARSILAPCPVHSSMLEDIAHPIDPLLGLLNLTQLRARLTLPPNRNTSRGEQMRADLLALNQSSLRDKPYWDKRHALLGPSDDIDGA
jgi:hypothetical protein